MAKNVQEELSQRGYSTMSMPATGGAYVNPCDNAFNAALRHNYYNYSHSDYPKKLQAILAAYYAPSELSIQHYFEHIGWKGRYPSKALAKGLLNEGYRPGRTSTHIFNEMCTLFRAWKKDLRIVGIRNSHTFTHPSLSTTFYVWTKRNSNE